jgi:hypothetical protein
MNAVSLLREYVQEARGFFEETLKDATPEQAKWQPSGKAMPIAAQYAHVIVSQDMGLYGMLKGAPPLVATSWAGKTGLTEPPPIGPGAPLDEWARRVQIDLPTLRQYAQAVYAATDEYLVSLTDDDLDRPLDLSAVGLGQQTVAYVLNAGWIANPHLHCGEVSCLKGLQGAKGYPA